MLIKRYHKKPVSKAKLNKTKLISIKSFILPRFYIKKIRKSIFPPGKDRRTRHEQENMPKLERQLDWGSRRRKKPYSAYHPTITDRNYDSSFTIPLEKLQYSLYKNIIKYTHSRGGTWTKKKEHKGEMRREFPFEFTQVRQKEIRKKQNYTLKDERRWMCCSISGCTARFYGGYGPNKCFKHMDILDKWKYQQDRSRVKGIQRQYATAKDERITNAYRQQEARKQNQDRWSLPLDDKTALWFEHLANHPDNGELSSMLNDNMFFLIFGYARTSQPSASA